MASFGPKYGDSGRHHDLGSHGFPQEMIDESSSITPSFSVKLAFHSPPPDCPLHRCPAPLCPIVPNHPALLPSQPIPALTPEDILWSHLDNPDRSCTTHLFSSHKFPFGVPKEKGNSAKKAKKRAIECRNSRICHKQGVNAEVSPSHFPSSPFNSQNHSQHRTPKTQSPTLAPSACPSCQSSEMSKVNHQDRTKSCHRSHETSSFDRDLLSPRSPHSHFTLSPFIPHSLHLFPHPYEKQNDTPIPVTTQSHHQHLCDLFLQKSSQCDRDCLECAPPSSISHHLIEDRLDKPSSKGADIEEVQTDVEDKKVKWSRKRSDRKSRDNVNFSNFFVSRNMEKWDEAEVSLFLNEIGMGQYQQVWWFILLFMTLFLIFQWF